MKRIFQSLVLFCLILSLVPFTAAAAGSGAVTAVEGSGSTSGLVPAESYNYNACNYSGYSAKTIKSSLTAVDGGYLRVEYISGTIIAEQYDESFVLTESTEIPMELSLFGGIYICEDYNFLVFGQTNNAEDDSVEVIRVVRYSKDWERQAAASLYGANTTVPFDAGSLRFARSGDMLYIRTSHQMYALPDTQKRHQANLTMSVCISDMTVTDQYSIVMNTNYGYVSHSFNQFIQVDGTDLLAVDHGDAGPRSVVLMKYNKPAGQETFTGKVTYADVLTIAENTGHYNYTGVSVGGFAFSDSHYLVAGSTCDQGGGIDQGAAQRNIFVTVTPKGTLTADATGILYLTDYAEGDGVSLSTPHLVKLDGNSFCLLWASGDQVYYCTLDGQGQKTSEVASAEGKLSDCAPIVVDGKIVWYVTQNSAPVFYTLDLNHSHSYTDVVTPPTCTEQGYTTHTCECGSSYQGDFTDALGHSFDEGTMTQEAAEEQNSMTVYQCSACGIYHYRYGHTTLGMYWLAGFRPEGADPYDPALKYGHTVSDPITDTELAYGYEIPEDGATVVICFSYACGYSQSFMQQLDQCDWLDNPYVNFVAVESKAENAADVLSFMEACTPNSASLINYRYQGSHVTQDYMDALIVEDNYYTYPMVFVITGSDSVQNPVYGTDGMVSTGVLYDVLCHVSESFAAYEGEGGKPDPVCPHTVTLQTNTIEPTCDTEGYTGDTVCADCGEVLESGMAIASLGHDWDAGIVTKEPTCDGEGEITYTCTRCTAEYTEKLSTLCGSMIPVDKEDTVVSRNYTVYDPLTGNSMVFSYETPEDGVTMLVFFSHVCGNCQWLMSSLDECDWLDNPYLNITAVEAISGDAASVMDFINTYTPNVAPMIDFRYTKSTSIVASYNRLFSSENSFVWPIVVIIDESGEANMVRYASDMAVNVDTIYNTLCCVSPSFAEYEKVDIPDNTQPEEPQPEEPDTESEFATVQTVGQMDYSAIQEVLVLVNQYRAEEGLEPLILDEELTQAAMTRAVETTIYWDHARPNGTSCFTILEEFGLSVSAAGENIAVGQTNAAEVTDGWMNSSGHRANILDADFTHIGIGCVISNNTRYWVQMFGSGLISQENCSTTGLVNYSSAVEILQANLSTTLSQAELNISLDSSELGSWTTQIYVKQFNSFRSTLLIPILSDVKDENGNVIATLANAGDGTGAVILTATAEGTGTVTLPVYEEQAAPLTLTVTVHVHEYTQTEVVAPTCRQQGYTNHICSCGSSRQDSYTDPVEHSWDEGTIIQEPTPDHEGAKLYTCIFGCGSSITEAIFWEPDACTHENTRIQNEIDVTCTTDGYTGDTVCADCGQLMEEGESIPPAGHDWDEGTVTREPTAAQDGEMTYTCAVCGETKTEAIPWEETECVHSGTTIENAAEATCTEDGYSGDTVCADCGEVLKTGKAIPAAGHSWDQGEVTREPTEDEAGERTYTCTVCQETKTETIPPVSTGGFRRIAGANRFETAFEVANAMKEALGIEKFDSIIVASGTNFADALSGSYLATVRNAPILLSYSTSAINNSVKDYIRENLNPGGTVYILGGTSAVPASMETELEEFAVKRLAGTDRFGTNLAILEEAGYAGKAILACTGLAFADSLSASAAGLPILLVWKDLTADQKAFLEGISGSIYVIGGEGAVSSGMMEQLSRYGYTERLGGSNRFQTSVLIAETFFPNAESAALAYAWDFPDGLCGGPLAAVMDAPLILTMPCYEADAAEFAVTRSIDQGVVLGGEGLISNEAVNAVTGTAEAGHRYSTTTVEPTCTSGGYDLHTCEKCGHSYKDNKTKANGHDNSETIVYATFDQGGYTQRTCNVCGHSETADKTEKLSSTIKEVFDLVNQARKEAGVAPLVYYFEGQEAADIRATEVKSYFSHTRPNGQSCFTVFDELGLERWPSGENIAYGYPTAAAVMNGWMNSQGHRENILNPSAQAILIGKDGSSWVMLLTY
ncbi:MAG: cell wall-binding repeat-containing protein [Oscillospiraceae bacterium]|nr:cell wall-binding repeat-containing protein [Oscillospiraceae bacterium]